jgi:hypothetical protein
MAKGSLSIQVKRADNQQPIAGASVTLVRLPITFAKTDLSGYANFEEIGEGSYQMLVSHPSFRPGSLPWAVVSPNQTQLTTISLYPAKDIYFAIYYKVDDHAFRYAANYWKRQVTASPVDPASIQFVMREVSTAAEFKAAWNDIYKVTQAAGAGAKEGRVFSHASLDSSQDGLEFRKDANEDGTISKGELASLPKLQWVPGGTLVLHGCNSGVTGDRGWTPAEVLAKSQGVPTTGQTGYAYFSQQYGSYLEWHPSYSVVYLWAYKRRLNSMFGDGTRMPGKVFTP